MAIIEPLRAIRYHPRRVPGWRQVVAPPYDVIDAQQRETLLSHPHNIAQLDLAPADKAGSNRYQSAAGRLQEWLAQGLLMHDREPAFYPYEQTFTWSGVTRSRRGFFARVRLEALESGHIYPHEATFRGPKQDRLSLMEATDCALSPVFGLYPDDDGRLSRLLSPAFQGKPLLDFEDGQGQRHRLWRVAPAGPLERLTTAFADQPLLIADGHHRYETALAYRDALAAQAGGSLPGDHPANYTLFVCVSLHDPGLLLLPTHRCVRFPTQGAVLHVLMERTRGAWQWEELDLPSDPETIPELLAEEPSQLGYWDVQAERLYGLRPQATDPLDSEEPLRSPAWRRLPVALLHRLLLAPTLESPLGEPEIFYTHQVEETWQLCQAERCQGAFLLPAVPKAVFAQLALARERLPQKTTYFYPKLLTGLLLYPLVNR